jgi:hypothetical protein
MARLLTPPNIIKEHGKERRHNHRCQSTALTTIPIVVLLGNHN